MNQNSHFVSPVFQNSQYLNLGIRIPLGDSDNSVIKNIRDGSGTGIHSYIIYLRNMFIEGSV